MANYNVSGIIYAKATAANLALAGSATGGAEEDATDRISPPTILIGRITSSTATVLVTGVGTTFEDDLLPGEYLFSYDFSGVPSLVGKIQAINSQSQITLTSEASTDVDSRPFGSSLSLIRNNDSILIRIPAVASPGVNNYIIPDWKNMRLAPKVPASYNDENITQMFQYTDAGEPLIISAGNVYAPFTITPRNLITSYVVGGVSKVFSTAASLPSFLWAQLNPYGDNGVDVLAPATIYRLFTLGAGLPGISISPQMNASILVNAGYNVSATVSGGGGNVGIG